MKITAKKQSVMHQEDGTGILMLEIPIYGDVLRLQELSKEDTLAVDIKTKKSGRSLEQNRYMWALINEIDKAINGSRSNDPWGIYINALKRTGAKSDTLIAVNEAEKDLKKAFRAVEFVQPYDDTRSVFRCYYGSSKMNTKEMTDLIDTLLDIASELDINTGYWEELLK